MFLHVSKVRNKQMHAWTAFLFSGSFSEREEERGNSIGICMQSHVLGGLFLGSQHYCAVLCEICNHWRVTKYDQKQVGIKTSRACILSDHVSLRQHQTLNFFELPMIAWFQNNTNSSPSAPAHFLSETLFRPGLAWSSSGRNEQNEISLTYMYSLASGRMSYY